jgi:16S rRNA (guanine527-N7)-methyltransferase
MNETSAERKISFRNLCRVNSILVSDLQLDLLDNYQSLLLAWNQKINLISRQDEQNFWNRHIVGSVSFLFRVQVHETARMLDLGTGGGLPGIPLAILFPSMTFTLVDSIQKKINAVLDMVAQLGLQNVSIVRGRAEELSTQAAFAGKFDYVVARGVASMEELIRWSKPFLKSGSPITDMQVSENTPRPMIPVGSLLLLKGGELSREIETARAKYKPKSLTTVSLLSENVEDAFEKKLIIVQP